LDNIADKKIIQYILIGILSSKDIDLIIENLSRMAISGTWHITLLLTLKPLKHFKVSTASFEIKNIAYVTMAIIFDFTLGIVYFFV